MKRFRAKPRLVTGLPTPALAVAATNAVRTVHPTGRIPPGIGSCLPE